jgi:ribosomal protein L40E
MDSEDLARLQEWTTNHLGHAGGPGIDHDATPPAVPALAGFGPGQGLGDAFQPSKVKFEAGLRVCPACGKPVHMSATTCRECGSPVPRR